MSHNGARSTADARAELLAWRAAALAEARRTSLVVFRRICNEALASSSAAAKRALERVGAQVERGEIVMPDPLAAEMMPSEVRPALQQAARAFERDFHPRERAIEVKYIQRLAALPK